MTTEYLYWWPVEVKIPDQNRAGHFETQKFKMRFLAMPSDEGDAMRKEIAALPEEEQEERQDELLMRVCRDWDEDVVDERGQPVPFSKEALQQALRFPWNRIGIYGAYARSLTGQEARRGN